MKIFFYNTLSHSVEEFHPIRPGRVGLYSCGPTVYGYAHIGNLRAYVFVDVLRRTLEAAGFDVNHVMNITDVGHLTDDADAGEDKMIVTMRREGKTIAEIADFYTKAFLRDLRLLNIKMPGTMPRATEHIAEQIELIQKIEEKGLTYKTSDGIYFDTSKLPGYGRLSGQKIEEKMAGARVEVGEKKQATDFALWKFSQRGIPPTTLENGGPRREMEWPSPWGTGFPGWHIECSAMGVKELGVPFDIHTGGVDHIAVHHENELAQTEAALGERQANVWLHNEFLIVEGRKMSKSLDNLYTAQDLIEKGYDPIVFRYLCLGAHYRTKLNFTWEALEGARNALRKLFEQARRLSKPQVGCADYEREFLEAVFHDLNTPRALAVMWRMLDNPELPSAGKARSLLFFDRILGLRLENYVAQSEEIPEAVSQLIKDREAARQAKDWSRADALREEIAQRGFIVEDGPDGTRVSQGLV